MPTPSMAAAIITPARLDFDSRWSRVIIALPAPSAISSASSSRPAERQADAGSRRNSARNAGSTSRRSISWAAMSASEVATSRSAHARYHGLRHHDDHGDEERHPERDQHGPYDVSGGELVHHGLVSEGHADRTKREHGAPHQSEDSVARQHRRIGFVVLLAGEPARELRLGPAPQPRLAQDVDEDLVAVAVDERVEVEEGSDVGREREVEEEVADRAVGEQQAAEREHGAQGEVRRRARRADGDAAVARLEPCLGGVHEGVGEDEQQLEPGALYLAPERRHRHPVRGLVDRDHEEATRQEDKAAQPELGGHHERRPVATHDQIAEDPEPGHDQHRQRDQHRPREQHPPAGAVDSLEGGAENREGLRPWSEEPPEPALWRLLAAVWCRLRDAGQEPAL